MREYWIVSPDARGVQAFLLDGGRYYVAVYTDQAPVQALPGCVIDLKKAFAALD
ncbi:MAG: Uma2 family endonuclease [Acidobacteriota bacterium]|nr:Uma2 family endonuclease [Acidobacteriota bacterium]